MSCYIFCQSWILLHYSNAKQTMKKRQKNQIGILILFSTHHLACEMMPTGVMWPTSFNLMMFFSIIMKDYKWIISCLFVCLALGEQINVHVSVAVTEVCHVSRVANVSIFSFLLITLIVIYTFILADWRLCPRQIISTGNLESFTLWSNHDTAVIIEPVDLVHKGKDNQLCAESLIRRFCLEMSKSVRCFFSYFKAYGKKDWICNFCTSFIIPFCEKKGLFLNFFFFLKKWHLATTDKEWE